MTRIKVCKDCGSDEIQYEAHTPDGKREMYRCFECGSETLFRATVKTFQDIQDENTIDLYSVWGKEDPQ